MRLLEEMSIADIAIYTGKDRNYVKTTYKRGVKRLREIVESGAPYAMQDNLGEL
jgi:DNA-directed RNA polymerase specialized sigma24 family protein